MKPIKLEMRNFGPFINETINFDELNEHQLFLISGKTGSGKTTIFDAVIFSLYGKASTDARDEKSLPSQFADEAEKSFYVAFEFLLKGKHYRVERDLPNLSAPKAGIYEIKADEKIPLADFKKKTEVKHKINEIIQLDLNQFKQIFILPQGEFKRMLVSSSNDKSQILSQLFNTERFKRITDALKRQVSELREQSKQLELQMQKIMKLTLSNDIQDYHEAKTLLDTKLNEYNLKYEVIQQKIKQLEEEIKIHQKQLLDAEQLNQQIHSLNEVKMKQKKIEADAELFEENCKQKIHLNDIVQYKSLLEEQSSFVTQLEQLNINRKNTENDLNAIQLTIDTLNKQFAIIIEQEKEIQKLNHYVIQNKLFLREPYDCIEDNIRKTKSKIEELNRKIIESTFQPETISLNQQLLNKLTTDKFELLDKQDQLKSINNEINQKVSHYESLEKDIDALIQLENEIKQNHTLLATVESKIEKLNLGHNDLNEELIQQMRNGLQLGQRCPVCAQIVTIQNNDASKDIQMHHQLMHEYQTIKDALSKLDTKVELKKESITNEDLTLSIEAITEQKIKFEYNSQKTQQELTKVIASISKIDLEIANLKATIQKLESKKEYFNQLNDQLNIEKSLLQQLEHQFQQFQDQSGYTSYKQFSIKMHENETKIEHYHEQKIKLDSEIKTSQSELLKIQSKMVQQESESDAIKKWIEKLSLKLDAFNIEDSKWLELDLSEIQNELQRVTEWVDQYEKDKYALNAQFDILKAYEHMSIVETKPIESKITEYNEMLNSEIDKKDQFISTFAVFKSHLQEFNSAYEVFYKKVNEKQDLFILADSFQGVNAHRISLEDYVLQYYLDQVLKEANKRLLKMSNHRYQLERKTYDFKRNQKNGLEIVVYDVHSNSNRDISSLSGGETFLASLSLALGLSDYVSQTAGGIQFDAVFIDEGFGTLDSETLDTAIEALYDLQMSGKIVGIISHVERLKEQIPAILNVQSNGATSQTHFVVK